MKSIELGDLEAFAIVGRHLNFRKAALASGVSASRLSENLRRLEAQLGLRLLNRTTRSVALTEAGRRLLERVSPSIDELHQSVDEVRGMAGTPAGTLRINAPPPAIETVLAPLVAPFLAACPDVRLEIASDASLVDIVAQGYDAGVRWGEHLAQDVIAVPLGPAQRYVVAGAPGLVARHGPPLHPRDLLERPCIRIRFPSGLIPDWEFEKDGETLRLAPEGVLVTANMALQRRAALDGVGFAALFEDHVADDIAAGRLVSVLDDWLPPFPGPFLYFPGNRTVSPALRAFVDFVKARRASQDQT